MTDSVAIIIPARFASTRFPGKPLAPLRGADGVKPLVQRSWEAARRAADFARVVVATDDRRIADAVKAFGGEVVMTSAAARNGTERCAEALTLLGDEPDLVINLQGDSPLVRRADLAALRDAWRDSGAPVLSPFIVCDPAMDAAVVAEASHGRVGGTTVVVDAADHALYFSKRPIPHRTGNAPALKLHVGVYAYTPDALRCYAGWRPAPLEEAEGLEQLRFLERGMGIRMVEVPIPPGGFWEVNNPEDILVVERALAPATGTSGKN